MGVVEIAFRLLKAACLAAGLAVLGSGGAAAYSPPPVAQQHQQAIQQLSQTRQHITDDQEQMGQLDADITSTQNQITSDRTRLAGVARTIYKQPPSPLIVLVESGSLIEALRGLVNFSELGIVARSDRSSLTALQRRIDQDRQQRARIAADLTAQEDLLRVQLIQVSSLEIWDRVSLWQAANQDFKIDPSPGHSAPNRFVMPVAGAALTQGFGPTMAWFEPPFGGYAHFHTGLDLAAPYGTPVVATDDAVVLFSGNDGYGYGNYIILGHSGGLVTLYGHLASIAVKQGDQLKQGDVIGAEGSTGNSTGPHLHFELRVNGNPSDPTSFLSGS